MIALYIHVPYNSTGLFIYMLYNTKRYVYIGAVQYDRFVYTSVYPGIT